MALVAAPLLLTPALEQQSCYPGFLATVENCRLQLGGFTTCLPTPDGGAQRLVFSHKLSVVYSRVVRNEGDPLNQIISSTEGSGTGTDQPLASKESDKWATVNWPVLQPHTQKHRWLLAASAIQHKLGLGLPHQVYEEKQWQEYSSFFIFPPKQATAERMQGGV